MKNVCSGLSESRKDVLICPWLMNRLLTVPSSHFQGVFFSLSPLHASHRFDSVLMAYLTAGEVNSKPLRFVQLLQKQPLLPKCFAHMGKEESAFSSCLKHWLVEHP